MKTLYEVFIIDDNKSSIDVLCKSFENKKQFTVSGFSLTAAEGQKKLMLKRPDILFLDVEMPEITGFDFLNEIKESICWPMQVVFYTAYDKYARQALRASAFDFLLKPYTEEELNEILEKFLISQENDISPANKFDKLPNINQPNKTLMIPDIQGHKFVRVDNICFFKYDSIIRRWHLNLADGSSIRLKHEIKAEDIQKMAPNCIRISQKHIINPDYLDKCDNFRCFLLPPYDQITDFTVSRDCYKNIRERFLEL